MLYFISLTQHMCNYITFLIICVMAVLKYVTNPISSYKVQSGMEEVVQEIVILFITDSVS